MTCLRPAKDFESRSVAITAASQDREPKLRLRTDRIPDSKTNSGRCWPKINLLQALLNPRTRCHHRHQATSGRLGAGPPRLMGNLRPHSRTRPFGGSPRTTMRIASRRVGVDGQSLHKASVDDHAFPGGSRDPSGAPAFDPACGSRRLWFLLYPAIGCNSITVPPGRRNQTCS
jgi:hypothetical protein